MFIAGHRYETVSYWIANAVYRAKQKQKIYERCGIISRRDKNLFLFYTAPYSLNPGATIVKFKNPVE